jgi:hypothetical protein
VENLFEVFVEKTAKYLANKSEIICLLEMVLWMFGSSRNLQVLPKC